MKKRVRKMSIGQLSMAVLVACTGLTHANMLTNADFETAGVGGASDPADWDRTNTSIVKRFEEVAQPGHGDWMLLLGDSANAFHWASQTVAVTAGVWYAASAEFKGALQDGEAAYIYVGWLDSGGSQISNTFSTYSMNDVDYIDYGWVTRSLTAVAPAGAVEAQVRLMYFGDGNGDSALWGDNVDFGLENNPNMIANHDIETAGVGGVSDPADWDRTDTGVVKRHEEAGQAGHGDWMMVFNDNVNASHWASQTFSATPGYEYTASAEFKGLMQSGEAALIYIGWLDSGGSEISNHSASYTTADADYVNWAWVTRSVTAIAPAGAVQVEVRMMSQLDGGTDSGLFGDNAELRSFEVINDPATILSVSSVSNNVLKMVIDAPSSAGNYYPKSKLDLVTGTWSSVPHSDDGVNPFVVTNLGYSTTDATGTNEVIYVNATNSAGFFGIGEE